MNSGPPTSVGNSTLALIPGLLLSVAVALSSFGCAAASPQAIGGSQKSVVVTTPAGMQITLQEGSQVSYKGQLRTIVEIRQSELRLREDHPDPAILQAAAARGLRNVRVTENARIDDLDAFMRDSEGHPIRWGVVTLSTNRQSSILNPTTVRKGEILQAYVELHGYAGREVKAGLLRLRAPVAPALLGSEGIPWGPLDDNNSIRNVSGELEVESANSSSILQSAHWTQQHEEHSVTGAEETFVWNAGEAPSAGRYVLMVWCSGRAVTTKSGDRLACVIFDVTN